MTTRISRIDDSRIYEGERGERFTNLIYGILKKGRVRNHYIDELLTDNALQIYSAAFTTRLAQERLGLEEWQNYEFYEHVGDSIINACITMYMSNRFRQLQVADGVKVLARLKIVFCSKKTFSKIAESLGFWEFITASENERDSRKKTLLEDSLEAFIYATSHILDTKFRPPRKAGVGFGVVYDIVSSLYDEYADIELKYDKLFDAKTRLKELFDIPNIKQALGKMDYKNDKYEVVENGVTRRKHITTFETKLPGQEPIVWGTGIASIISDSQQIASREALKKLNHAGYSKSMPESFARFLT